MTGTRVQKTAKAKTAATTTTTMGTKRLLRVTRKSVTNENVARRKTIDKDVAIRRRKDDAIQRRHRSEEETIRRSLTTKEDETIRQILENVVQGPEATTKSRATLESVLEATTPRIRLKAERPKTRNVQDRRVSTLKSLAIKDPDHAAPTTLSQVATDVQDRAATTQRTSEGSVQDLEVSTQKRVVDVEPAPTRRTTVTNDPGLEASMIKTNEETGRDLAVPMPKTVATDVHEADDGQEVETTPGTILANVVKVPLLPHHQVHQIPQTRRQIEE